MTVYPLNMIRMDADLTPLDTLLDSRAWYVQPHNSYSNLLVIRKLPTGKQQMLLELYLDSIKINVDYK